MDSTSGLNILNGLLKSDETYNSIANTLNVAVGTVKRWVDLNSVPNAYLFELMKIAKVEIDYESYSYKMKDQFYTNSKTSAYCVNKMKEVIGLLEGNINEFVFIEPSAGNGSFLQFLPETKRIGLDVEPKRPDILKQDFLSWKPSEGNRYISIGNPPFGLRGQLALKFINHSSEFSEYVCFILPQLFESDGKGSPRKRVNGLNLIHSEKISPNFEEPNGKIVKVECIFQIWSKNHTNDKYLISNIVSDKLKVYSLSDGGTSSTTRNKKMFDICDVYLPSTCFGKENMKCYGSLNELPGKKGYGIVFMKNKEINKKKCNDIDWSSIAFLSTNSAYNIRTSQIIHQF